MKDVQKFKLTGSVTVGDVRAWIAVSDDNAKTNLTQLIEHRFINRYIKHLNHPDIDGGFFKMAICCMMIETLESFKQGLADTRRQSEAVFVAFFNTEQQAFPDYHKVSTSFYRNIRCGILHQAETTNAWRIHIRGPLLDIEERTINANAFVQALQLSFDNYLLLLRDSSMNTKIWDNALKKLSDICKNCETKN